MRRYISVLLFITFLTVLPVSAEPPSGEGDKAVEEDNKKGVEKDDKEIAEMVDMLAVLDMLETFDVVKDMDILTRGGK